MENQALNNAPVSTVPAMIEPENQRAIAEVQAAIMLAKKFPRDEVKAKELILNACKRIGLAESATYDYARGGNTITGPSIRLLEVAAKNWGNIQYGIRELDQRAGESIMEAFSWDMESNVRVSRVFTAKHVRDTKKGSYRVESTRDVYEVTANMGARRVRACLEGNIPRDILDDAVAVCEKTMKANADTSPEGIGKMLERFEPLGVTKAMIEKRIQRKVEAIAPGQMIGLRKIFNSLNDAMSIVSDWFEVAAPAETTKKTGTEAAKEALKKGKGKDNSPLEQAPATGAQEAQPPETGEVKDGRPNDTLIPCPSDDGAPQTLAFCRENCMAFMDCQACKP